MQLILDNYAFIHKTGWLAEWALKGEWINSNDWKSTEKNKCKYMKIQPKFISDNAEFYFYIIFNNFIPYFGVHWIACERFLFKYFHLCGDIGRIISV